MKPLTILVAVLSIGTFTSCTSKSISANKPSGVDAAIWDDYCRHGNALVGYLNDATNGTVTPDEFVSKLAGNQHGFQTDADATGGVIGGEFQAVADSIGRAKVAVATGGVPDYAAILEAVKVLPSCV